MLHLKNLAKQALSLFTVVLMVAFATGCGAPQLSAKFDEEAVKQKAQDVIALLNAQDSAGIREISVQILKDALTDDTFAQIYAALGEGGAFVEVTDITAYGSTDKKTGEEYAVVVVQAKYEKKSFTYTISFDTDMNLAGIYYK